jgi:hypothetical protein
MSPHPTPARRHDGLSKLAWDVLAEQMLLAQLIGSINRARTGKPTVRVCQHCGDQAVTDRRSEPLCHEGWPAGHSYVDLDVTALGELAA